MRYLKQLSGSPQEMANQVLSKAWKDGTKENALDVVEQYAEYLSIPFEKPPFKAYDNEEMYVPSPEMVKQFLYRVRNLNCRTRIKVAVETGASAGEVWRLTWKDFNAQNKTIMIVGNKGHRTLTYHISDELFAMLLQIPKKGQRIFAEVLTSEALNDNIRDYKKRLAKETGNQDFLRIHFHTFRHFAISWQYFKTKDIVDTQRFARHCNITNTLRYIHIVKSWVKANEYNVVYADSKEELTRYLADGYSLVTKTEWGYCLNKPKPIC